MVFRTVGWWGTFTRTSSLAMLFLFLLAGCAGRATPGRIVTYTRDPATGKEIKTRYSEYFELDEKVFGGRLRLHLLITLGHERVPRSWVFPPGPWIENGQPSRSARNEGMIEEVLEIYFTNLGDSPLKLEKVELTTGPVPQTMLTPLKAVIEPRRFIKTDPIVTLGSIDQPALREVVVRYWADGTIQETVGQARRLLMSELTPENFARKDPLRQ